MLFQYLYLTFEIVGDTFTKLDNCFSLIQLNLPILDHLFYHFGYLNPIEANSGPFFTLFQPMLAIFGNSLSISPISPNF